MSGSRARFAFASLLSLVLIPHGPTVAQTTVAAADSSAPVTQYKPVTSEELLNPSPADWLLPRRTYDGTAYSPLNQINTENIKSLHLAWSFATGVVEGHEAPPIVNNGVMFVATPEAQILALDVRTGNLLWRYKQVNLGRSVTASNANPPETSRV